MRLRGSGPRSLDRLVSIGERRAALQRRQHRDQAHRDDQRNQHRERDRQRLVAEQLAGHALHEHQRKEYRDRRQRRRGHGHADLGGAAHGCFEDRRAFLAQACDVFEHDNRVVNDHAGRKRQTAERHHVQGQVQLAHEEERGDQRNRQRQGDDERAPGVAEEKEDDQDREHAAEQRIELDLVERVLDEDRLVLDRAQLCAGRQRILQLVELRLHRRRDVHGVAVAFLVDRQLDRLAPVDAHDAFALLEPLAHFGDVLQLHRHTAVDLDQQLAHFVERLELVDRAHEETLAAFLDAAAGGIHVFVLQARNDVVDVDTEPREFLLVDRDVDLVLEAATDLDCGDTRDRFDALLQIVVGEAAKLLELRFTGLALHREPEPDDRIGRWIEAQQQRLLRFQRQLQRVELVAHLKARHVHVGAPSELEHDVGLAGARDRMHLAHVLDDADGLLDRLADQVLDFERCGAFVLGAHGQRRIGQVRQQVDLEAEQSDQAEQHQGQRQHADRDTPARGQLGQIHDALPPVGVPASACGVSPSTCTSVPSRTALRPIVMTRSPSFRPSRISTRSPSA